MGTDDRDTGPGGPGDCDSTLAGRATAIADDLIAVIALIDARLSREDAAGAERLQRLQAARDSAARALELTGQLTAIGADDRSGKA